ncbi:hypothetical protein HYC85_009143 [Camellia sinensis]|uniref:Myb/SANT-like domain-containing protein n=1 Tax=Camellia sinensis TaxID=4442 RepID=A0A7J7HER5_CAMSI|nr:hypothetical protein HYC85_009143 [Camellia sinensis]
MHCSVEEQVAIFLHIVSHNVKNRPAKRYYKRSGETVSRYFHMFTYVLAGWEGSTSDSRILGCAINREHGITCPPGFPLLKHYITPFRSTRYHLNEIRGRVPTTAKELFNHGHSSLRNAIERSFGINEMEAHESGKKRGKNIVWSKEMDKCLILEVVHQANEGYKVDKGFKDQAYVAACSSLNSSFNLFLSCKHYVNCLKTIKKKYRLVQEMLSKSGFSLNPMTKMVECSDQVWTTYVAANPDAKELRGKKIEMLDELSIVCGNDQATGEWACSAKDVNANYSKKTNYTEDEYSHLFDPIDNMVANDVVAKNLHFGKRNHISSMTVTEQSKKPKNAELVAETMVVVSTNMARLADAYEKSKPCIDYLELYKAIMDVEELDINS